MIPKCMLQNRQTNTMSPPARSDGSGQGGGDDEHSRRQSSVQIRVFPVSPTSILKQNWQDRHVLSLCLHVLSSLCLGLGSGVHMAVCCILSALAFLWLWDQLMTQGSQRGWGRGAGSGVPGLHCLHTPTQHEVSGSATPSATWDTGGHSHPVWNVM